MLQVVPSASRLYYFAILTTFFFLVGFLSIDRAHRLKIPFSSSNSARNEIVDPAYNQFLDSSLLLPYVRGETFKYARKYLRVRQGLDPDQYALPRMDHEKFRPRFQQVTLNDVNNASFRTGYESEVITLETPVPDFDEPEDWPILIGLATTVERLESSFAHMRHWLPRSGISLLAIVPPSPRNARLLRDWRLYGVDITLIESRTEFVDRLISLFREMYDHAETLTPYPKWFCIADDDTFFPSISRLRAGLDAFDAKRPFWLGALSEATDRIEKHGYIAFGGAGMFFSPPLLAQIAPFSAECLKKAPDKEYGDSVIAFCVESHSRTRLTSLLGLHQLDLFGDASGVYESGFKPLSLHHWEKKRWGPASHDVPMDRIALVANITGDEALFQRWRFADGWVITNGYSVVRYNLNNDIGQDFAAIADGDDSGVEFDKMEFTWDGPEKFFTQSLGPFRRKLTSEEKKSWLFVDSMITEDTGSVRQLHMRKEDSNGMLELLELVWLKS